MADTDLLNDGEAMAAIGAKSSDLVLEVMSMVEGITAQIEEYTGPVVARAVTEYHDGGSYIVLRTTPILSVTSVTEYDTAGTATVLTAETNTTKPESGYLLDSCGHLARITRRSSGSGSSFACGDGNVKVVTSAGRYASTDTVGGAWKTLARTILRVRWQQEAPAWARSPEFEQDPEVLAPTAIESIIRASMRTQLRPGVLVGFA